MAAQHFAPPRSRVNDFALKLANVNGTGSSSANNLLMRAIFRIWSSRRSTCPTTRRQI